MALLPDQVPEAAHELAFADDQFRVALPPVVTVLGLALKAIVGNGGVTETVADCEALPPVPVHAKVYIALAVSPPAACDGARSNAQARRWGCGGSRDRYGRGLRRFAAGAGAS